jgi:hypothetical protein
VRLNVDISPILPYLNRTLRGAVYNWICLLSDERSHSDMENSVKAALPSSWAREFIRKRGGVLNVAWRTVCMS